MVRNFLFSDPLNKLQFRNKKNTSRFNYNCGGYALGTYSWYCPKEDLYGDAYGYEDISESEEQEKLDECIENMLIDFEGQLRVIQDLKELKDDEYAIAFKMVGDSNEDDFHFMKRAKNGHWTHKIGSHGIQHIRKEKVFKDTWYNPFGDYEYLGKTVLLAKKEEV